MSKPEIEVILSPKGIISFLGNESESLVGSARAVELWHSQPGFGLAFRFLESPTPSALALEREPGGLARVDAAAFLAKVGYDLPESDQSLFVGSFDEKRRVLSTRLGE